MLAAVLGVEFHELVEPREVDEVVADAGVLAGRNVDVVGAAVEVPESSFVTISVFFV